MQRRGASVPSTTDSLEDAPLERVESELCEVAAQIYAGTCRWLELVAEFDRRDGWGDTFGICSTAEWLAWRCSLTPRAAREHVRVARRLAELPGIHAAFATGELSYSKVRALTRIATTESEDGLLEFANHATAAQLERTIRAARRVSAAQAADAHEACFCQWHWEEDGSLSVSARLPAEDGAAFLRALDASRDRLNEQRWELEGPKSLESRESLAPPESRESSESLESPESPESPGSPRSMGPSDLPETACRGSAVPPAPAETACRGSAVPPAPAETACRGSAVPGQAGDEVPRRPTNAECFAELTEAALTGGPGPASSADRYQVTVHVDAGRLTDLDPETDLDPGPDRDRGAHAARDRGAHAAPDSAGACYIEGGAAIAAQTARRIVCDASILKVATGEDRRVLSIGRRSRSVPPALRRALEIRDGGCRFPGCERRRFTDAHHVRHWADGGGTSLDNLILLCRRHHRLVHEGCVSLRPGPEGEPVFRLRAGEPIAAAPPLAPSTASELRRRNHDAGIEPGASTVLAGTGERIDLAHSVDAVLSITGSVEVAAAGDH